MVPKAALIMAPPAPRGMWRTTDRACALGGHTGCVPAASGVDFSPLPSLFSLMNRAELQFRLDQITAELSSEKAAEVRGLVHDAIIACAKIADRYTWNIDDIEFNDDPRQWPIHIGDSIRSLMGEWPPP